MVGKPTTITNWLHIVRGGYSGHTGLTSFLKVPSFANFLNTMLRWSVTFIILAILAGVLGFGGIAVGFASIARLLFYLFVILLVISVLTGKKVLNR